MAALDTPTYESTKAVAADLDKAEALEFDAGRPYQLLVAEAEAYQAEVVNRATGDASRFNQIFQAYLEDKDVTKERIYIETVEEKADQLDKRIIKIISHVIISQRF